MTTDKEVIVNLTEALSKERKRTNDLMGVLNWIVNTIPITEIELARSVWGNTNTSCVLEARARAVSILTHIATKGA